MRLDWNDILHPPTVLRYTDFSLRRRHITIGQHFLEFMRCRGGPVNADAIHAWLLERLATHTAGATYQHLWNLGHLLKPPAISQWRQRHRGRIHATLEALRRQVQQQPTPVRGPLGETIEQFLNYRDSLRRGRRCEEPLRRLDRWLHQHGIVALDQLTHTLLSRFLGRNRQRSIRTSAIEQQAIQQFCRWLRRTEHIQTAPEAALRPVGHPSQHRPYIYTLKQLATLLEGLRNLGGWKGLTSFTALHLIYACGLRISEAVKLGIHDVDLVKRQIHIRFTKFGKSRTLPLGQRAAHYLEVYQQARDQRFAGANRFFVSVKGQPLRPHWLRDKFRTICLANGLCTDGRARIHDVRHTFAVHRLYKWYADGVDPRAKLPLLSAYMGHVLVEGTAHYLQMGEDLMRIASKRCARSLDEALAAWEDGGE
jgi:site-specific recombinase XerD